jgi:hypothetical protein
MTNRETLEARIDALELRINALFEASDFEDTDETIALQDELAELELRIDALDIAEEEAALNAK